MAQRETSSSRSTPRHRHPTLQQPGCRSRLADGGGACPPPDKDGKQYEEEDGSYATLLPRTIRTTPGLATSCAPPTNAAACFVGGGGNAAVDVCSQASAGRTPSYTSTTPLPCSPTHHVHQVTQNHRRRQWRSPFSAASSLNIMKLVLSLIVACGMRSSTYAEDVCEDTVGAGCPDLTGLCGLAAIAASCPLSCGSCTLDTTAAGSTSTVTSTTTTRAGRACAVLVTPVRVPVDQRASVLVLIAQYAPRPFSPVLTQIFSFFLSLSFTHSLTPQTPLALERVLQHASAAGQRCVLAGCIKLDEQRGLCKRSQVCRVCHFRVPNRQQHYGKVCFNHLL